MGKYVSRLANSGRWGMATILIGTLTGISACAMGPTLGVTSSPAPVASVTARLDAVMERSYPDFSTLRRYSVAAVVATAGSSQQLTVEGGDGLTVIETSTTLHVTTHVWGEAAADTVNVVQIGDGKTVVSDELGPLLQSGHTYLLFLRTGARPGYFVITGESTAYEKVGTTYRALVPQSDATQKALPASFDEKDLVSVVTGP
jgi:hypothetical protein